MYTGNYDAFNLLYIVASIRDISFLSITKKLTFK
jgi:hypothetical protein